MNISKLIKDLEETKEQVGCSICDTLKGDCNLCPFKQKSKDAKCVLSTLCDVEYGLIQLKSKIKETL